MKRLALLAVMLLFLSVGSARAGGKCYDMPELCAPMETAAHVGIAKAQELRLRPTGDFWYENEGAGMSSVFVYLDKPIKKVTRHQWNTIGRAMVKSLKASGVEIAWRERRTNSHVVNAVGMIFCVKGEKCDDFE